MEKTNGKQKAKKVTTSAASSKHTAVRAVPDSTLRRKPSARKRPMQRTPARETTADKRTALMKAADEVVKNGQAFKQEVSLLPSKYQLVMHVKPCEKVGFFTGKPGSHRHAHITYVNEELMEQLTSKYTTGVSVEVLDEIKNPMGDDSYLPMNVTTEKAGFVRSLFRVFSRAATQEEAIEALESGVDQTLYERSTIGRLLSKVMVG